MEKKKTSFKMKKIPTGGTAPKGWKDIPFNLRTVTAALLALVILFSVIAFFSPKPIAGIDYKAQINQAKTNITNYEASIEKYQKNIEECNEHIDALNAELPELEAALAEATNAEAPLLDAVREANAALDALCTRNSYNVNYCTEECQPLHEAVTEANTALEDARNVISDCEDEYMDCYDSVQDYQEEIEYLNESIADTKNAIKEQEKKISNLKSQQAEQMFGRVFDFVAAALCLVGLGLFVMLLITDAKSKLCLLFACGIVAAGALVSLLLSIVGSGIRDLSLLLYILINPHTYTILIMALFAHILAKRAKKPVVCRTVTIVAAVLSAFWSLALFGSFGQVGSMFICILFDIAMICLAFVIEPLVFTEYINIAKHIFLSLITCGIWVLVWIYHVTKNLNKVEGAEERTPRNELLLCMFLLFFFPYWAFKTAEYVESYGLEKDKSFHLEILAVVFAFVCPLFATVMIQNKINVAVGKPE